MNGEGYESAFEYDESMEADEAFEADESYEADESDEADESWEADEGSDEADESDESYEASDEADEADETFEADEAFESDEADEAVSASAQLRANRDKNRRAAWARRIAADQRVEAKRAASTQRSITSQIQAIKAGPPAKVAQTGSLQGAGVVTAILPNGRRSRMRIVPTVAPISEVNRLKNVVNVNGRRQAIATAKNSRAIASLARAQSSVVKKLTASQLKSDKDLGKRIVEAHNKLDQRITKELSGGSGSLDKHGKRLRRSIRRERNRQLMNNVLLASSLPFFAAYGERENPFAKNNLILTGSTLGFMVGDDLLDRYAGKSKGMRGLASALSYGAPILNGGLAYFLMRNQQHERFISGTLTTSAITASVDIKSLIGSASFDTFKSQDHAIVATLVDNATLSSTVWAAFNADKSMIDFELDVAPGGTAATIMWIVDTHAA